MRLDMKQHNKKGKLITFCGLDGCGKTTLINMLKDKLCNFGYKVELTKQPTNLIRESKIFRTYMDEENHNGYDYRSLSLLAASDRMQHSNKYIVPLLEKGNIVISDRYFYSCLSNLRARGFTEDNWIYDIAKHIPKPDLAFFLDIDVDIALSRIRERESERNKWIDIDLQYKLRDEYINICKRNSGVLINTNQTGETSFDTVWQYVTKLLEEDTIDKVIMEYVFLKEAPSKYASLKDDLGIDSLRIVEFIIKLEEKFDILISESDLDPSLLITVDDVYRLIHKYTN